MAVEWNEGVLGRLLLTALVAAGCNGARGTVAIVDGGPLTPDAGARDAGPPDAGVADAGIAAAPDGGPTASLPVSLPSGVADWKFLGPAQGGPNTVNGASLDQGGNLWVAGDVDGLYLLRAGSQHYERFTLADGLRPYGYMADGSVPPGPKYLQVLSVSGAWAGTVFVGYAGRPPGAGEYDCESNWDGPSPDPSIYKSGDADRVTLTATGISVVHYDISSGPGLVPVELRGREKLCTIDRIRYDPAHDKVWFGANHGFAMGEAHYAGTANCIWDPTTDPPTPPQTSPFTNAYGHEGCSGVLEHVHPAINGYDNNTNNDCCQYLTEDYFGVSVDPVTGDIWFGGLIRSTKFHYGVTNGDYYAAESQTEDPPYISNRIDVWPDQVEEPNIPHPNQLVEDAISGAAAMNDGSVWLSSYSLGLAHVDASGNVIARLTANDGLTSTELGSVVADPLDQSVWAGASWDGGISRLSGGQFTTYNDSVLGPDLIDQRVSDLQSFGTGPTRQIVASFLGDTKPAGAVAIYSGP